MRVLFLSVSAGFGGAERVLLECVTAIRTLHPDWLLRVVCLADGPLASEFAARGAEVRVLPLPRRFALLGESGGSTAATVARLAGSAWALRSYTRALRADMAAWRADLVHANGLKAHVLSAWAAPEQAKVVWHVHDYIGARRISSVLLRRYAHRASIVIANSRSVARDVRAVLGARTRVEVVHNGIDTGSFRPLGSTVDLDAAAGLTPAPSNTVRIGLVATYARWKGHDTFLRALGSLRDLPIRGYVVGGPVYETSGSQYSREELERVAHSEGLGDRLGFVPFQRDVAPVYRSLDVAVHASTKPEPFGLSVVEAMACGRTVVAAGAGGVEEIVEPGETGLLHRPGDAVDLAAQVRRAAGDARMRDRIGNAAARAARGRFSRERFGAALAGVYAQLQPSATAPAFS
jgi:glycosyltransferase involved in cell wall biosynthesis